MAVLFRAARHLIQLSAQFKPNVNGLHNLILLNIVFKHIYTSFIHLLHFTVHAN